MPELPEVQTVVMGIRPDVVGRRITGIILHRPDIVEPAKTNLAQLLTGQTVADVFRRAKRIMFALADGDYFYIHLGMTGHLAVVADSVPLEKHTHLIFQFDDAKQLRFTDYRRFGGLSWMGSDPIDESLGPEPLDLKTSELAARLGKTHRPIKSALLDQSLIAGLGNIYVDETLFESGIHPTTPADRLTGAQIGRLNKSIKKILRKAIIMKGSSVNTYRNPDGRKGNYQEQLRAYGRDGQPCGRCRTTIRRIVLSGRSTCFCPKCQPKTSAR